MTLQRHDSPNSAIWSQFANHPRHSMYAIYIDPSGTTPGLIGIYGSPISCCQPLPNTSVQRPTRLSTLRAARPQLGTPRHARYRAGTDDHAAFHRDHFDGRSGGAQVTLGVFASFGDRRSLTYRGEGEVFLGESRRIPVWVMRMVSITRGECVDQVALRVLIEEQQKRWGLLSFCLLSVEFQHKVFGISTCSFLFG